MDTSVKTTADEAGRSSTRSKAREALTRRAFLKQAAFAAAAMAAPFPVLADPYAPQAGVSAGNAARPVRPVRPIRVSGRVTAGRASLAGVAVTDGLTVTATDAGGRFELVSNTLQSFVSISTPDGYAIEQNPSGTASFYRPIMADESGEMATRFELAALDGSDERHGFLVLSDPQTQDAYEMELFHAETVPDVKTTAAGLAGRRMFGVGCGDIMFDDLSLYPEYERGVRRMDMPFFQVVGNHDLDMYSLTDRGSTETFGNHFGPGHYSFNRGAVHYVVLDDVFWYGQGYLGYLGADALLWLQQDLARVEPGSPVIVATHIPVLGSQHLRRGEESPGTSLAITNREALYRLLEPFDAHILTGHTHECEHVFEQGTHEHVTGAICGAWWSGPICHDGTPNGYCVYTIRGEQVRWRYKATGYGLDHQMRLHRTGLGPSAPGELLANVWNWDPEWTVRWYADGEPRGGMERRRSLDPLSVELHAGPDLPERREWVEPVPVDHMFRAVLTGEEREVVVEATDRFGRVYLGEWRR